MSKLNLIMPMGGRGSRFESMGLNLPKPLINIYGKPFFYWAVQSIVKFLEMQSLTFVVLREHIEKYKIDNEIKKIYPMAKIAVIPEVLDGAVLTCMNGIENIGDDEAVMFNDCDHLFICRKFYDFCNSKDVYDIDGGLLTFNSSDPRFSFVRTDQYGYVKESAEKKVISNDAICGAYYFKNKDIFKKAVDEYLYKCAYSEYYVSGVYNIMLEHNMKIRKFETDLHISYGTPQEYNDALSDNSYKKLL